MELSKEQKDEFFQKYDEGDIFALEYLDKMIMENAKDEELEELSYCVLRLNYVNNIAETERWKCFQKFSGKISDLYWSMKMELFDVVGITSEDWDNYRG